ncbi:sensor histidine kinase [Sutcliffiella horikoshii]|uniref:sensor histidine kinase n=1 Tax=Sutcliffiella horikoshii TaxID=79883 RepID=UPI00384F4BD3
MLQIEDFSLYVMFCVLAPLVGAFTLLFLFIFEKRIDLLENQANRLVLEKELQQAKYFQLNQQIQPHFFFNTLNSILSLARLNRMGELIRAIEVFSKFLKVKYKSNQSICTVAEELEYSGYYLEIQKIRFQSRLTYTIEMEEQVKQVAILPFLIQTLVENAFKHSFEKYPGEAQLNITLTLSNSHVLLTVWNSSEGVHLNNYQDAPGHGLTNIKRRLQHMYAEEEASFQLIHEHDGTRAVVLWPVSYLTNQKKEAKQNEHYISR